MTNTSPVQTGSIDKLRTTPDGTSPHYVIWSIDCDDSVIPNPVKWAIKYPTRDAAGMAVDHVSKLRRSMRGEPEQAWSDIARFTRCINPSLLPRFKNISGEIRPVPEEEHERQRQRLAGKSHLPITDFQTGDDTGKTAAGNKQRRPGSSGRKAKGGAATLPKKGSRAKAKKGTQAKGKRKSPRIGN